MIRSQTTIAPEAVADHYDELDAYYRAIWGEHVHHGYWVTGSEPPEVAAEALLGLLADRVGLRAGMHVCDVGCGYGAGAGYFAGRYGCTVTGLTVSRRQAERAAARDDAAGKLVFHCRDWLSNDLPGASFDAVVAVESTEHMEDKGATLREMRRVLRPGGRLGICAWLAADGVGGWRARRLLEPICREGRLPSMLGVSELRELVSESFEDVAFLDITRSVRRTWDICARRLAGRAVADRDVRRFLLDPGSRNRVFALTLLRIMLAYRTGAMRYGMLTATRGA